MNGFAILLWIYVIGFFITFYLAMKADIQITDPRAMMMGFMAKPTLCLFLACFWPIVLISIRSFRYTDKTKKKDKT